MGRQGLSSERRHSSCSSCNCGIDTTKWILKFCAVSTPDWGKFWSTNVIYGRTQRHNCHTENKPVIGRMQSLSSTNSDIFWVHTFHFGYGWKHIWLPWIHILEDLSHSTSYLCYWHILHATILIYIIKIWMVKTFPMLRAEQMNLKPSINLSLHVGSTGDIRFSSGWTDFG